MKMFLGCICIAAVAANATADFSFTFASAVGESRASALVPGGIEDVLADSYDISDQADAMYRRELVAVSESGGGGEGRASATSLNQANVLRDSRTLVFSLLGRNEVISTHDGGAAAASAAGEIGFDFVLDVGETWLFNYTVHSAFGGEILASLLFERDGGPVIIDHTITDPADSVGFRQLFLPLQAGNYRVRARIEASIELAGVDPPPHDGERSDARVLFGLRPIPSPSAAVGIVGFASVMGGRRQRGGGRGV